MFAWSLADLASTGLPFFKCIEAMRGVTTHPRLVRLIELRLSKSIFFNSLSELRALSEIKV